MNTNNILSKLTERTVLYFVIGILLVSIFCFFPCNVNYMLYYPEFFSIKEWVWIVPAAILVWCACFWGNGMRFGKYIITPFYLFLFVSNLLFITVLLTFHSQPSSDWSAIWIAAKEMAKGEFTDGLINGTYMHEIPYQLGLAFIQSLVIRCFGSNYEIIRVLNLVLMNLIIYCVYHFALRKSNVRVAGFAVVASSLFLSWTMTVGVMTNHQIGFLFLYLSLYLFEKGKLLPCCFAGVATACLQFVRPMGAIVLATLICYTIYMLIKGGSVKRSVFHLIAFFFSFVVVCFIFDSMLLNFGYIDERVSQSSRNMLHKITYTTYDSKIDGRMADFDYNYDEYNKAYKEEIIDMLKNHPKEIALGVGNKMCRFLGLLDYGFEFTYNHDELIWKRYPIKAVYSTAWFQYFFYLIIALYGYIKYRKRHDTDLYQIFFIGNTLVYLFIEAFSTYRFENYFYMLFLVGYGMSELDCRKGCIKLVHTEKVKVDA